MTIKVGTNKLRHISFYLYLITFLFFVIRYFLIDLTLGYGLGDLVYVALFSLWMLLSVTFYFLNKRRKQFSLIVSVVNVAMSIYLVLMIFVFKGSELG